MQLGEAIFYNYFRSSASYRVRIALALKGLKAKEVVDIDLRTGDQSGESYRRVAPAGLVPSFDFGERAFGQSLALIEWLDAKYPEPRLVPEDADTALAVREIALAIACDIHPIDNLRVLNYLTGTLGVSEEQKTEWYRHWVRTGFAAVEALIARNGDGGFCVGDVPTLADACLVPQVYNARRFEVDLTPYPRIVAVDAKCMDLPAFRDTGP